MPNGSNAARLAAPGLLAGRLAGGACGPERPAQILAQEVARYLRMQRYEEVSVEGSGTAWLVLGYPSGSAMLCEVAIAETPARCGPENDLTVSAAVQPTAHCRLGGTEDPGASAGCTPPVSSAFWSASRGWSCCLTAGRR